jgi:hypothetical protein
MEKEEIRRSGNRFRRLQHGISIEMKGELSIRLHHSNHPRVDAHDPLVHWLLFESDRNADLVDYDPTIASPNSLRCNKTANSCRQ